MIGFWIRTLEGLKSIQKTQVALADAIERNKSTVATWIRKGIIPPGNVCFEISIFLNVDIVFLLTGKQKEEYYSYPSKVKTLADLAVSLPDHRVDDLIGFARQWVQVEATSKANSCLDKKGNTIDFPGYYRKDVSG